MMVANCASKEPGQGCFGSMDAAPCSERSWIDLFSKETQNRFLDLRIQCWIFPKKGTLNVLKIYRFDFSVNKLLLVFKKSSVEFEFPVFKVHVPAQALRF